MHWIAHFDTGNYFLSQKNGLCAQTIGSVEECRFVQGDVVGGKAFQAEENYGGLPKGCYLAYVDGEPSSIWWNNHPSGSPNSDARQICVVGKEGRIVNV